MVRSAAATSKRCSSTECTKVPRTATGSRGSGKRSMVRNRYSSGQFWKSAARLGERAGRTSTGPASGTASAMSTSMLCTLNGGADRIGRLTGVEPRMLRIGRLAGADILIDPSLLLIGPLLIFMFADQFDGPGPGRGYALAAIFIVALYASIFIHELAHLLMGRAGGRSAHSIVLMLFGGVTHFDEGPRGPGQQFFTAIVGPVASLAVGAASLTLAGMSSGWLASVTWSLGVTNILLGLFNLLPGLPLD